MASKRITDQSQISLSSSKKPRLFEKKHKREYFFGSMWNTIESDPGVFSDLLDAIGTRGLEVEEVWGLDDESLAPLSKSLGLLFLFRYGGAVPETPVGDAETNASAPASASDSSLSSSPAAWFAHQAISNACGTQALLHIVMNSDEALHNFSVGPALSALRDFTTALPPRERGLALGDCESVRAAHNSFARAEPFADGPARTAKKGDDVFHFVAYVPAVGGGALELDGLASAPRLHPPPASGSGYASWLLAAGAALRARTASAGSSEIHFNLLAVVRDARGEALVKAGAAALRMDSLAGSQLTDAALIAAGFDVSSARAAAAAALAPPSVFGSDFAAEEIAQAGAAAAAAVARRGAWAAENARRRHNFVPFLLALAQGLAKAGVLRRLADEGRAGAAAARGRRRAEVHKRALPADD